MSISILYRLYWQQPDGTNREQDFATRTEATVRKLELRRQGITARMLSIRTTVDDTWQTMMAKPVQGTMDAYLHGVGG